MYFSNISSFFSLSIALQIFIVLNNYKGLDFIYDGLKIEVVIRGQ